MNRGHRFHIAPLLFLVWGALLVLPAVAQMPTGDEFAGAEFAEADQPQEVNTPPGETDRFLVGFMGSYPGAVGRNTVVNVTNLGSSTCSISVTYFKGLTSTPACTSTANVSAGQTRMYCTRSTAFDVGVECNSTCSPALVFDQGRAIVSSSGACSRVGVSAQTLYFDSTDSSMLGAAAVEVIRMP